MDVLKIYLFGSVRVTYGEVACPLKITRTIQALLAYLLLQRKRCYPRDVLIDLFWGEQSPERAYNCLNTALWRLRQVLEPAGTPRGAYLLTSSAGEVSFNWESNYWLDLATFDEKVHKLLAAPIETLTTYEVQALEQALRLYSAELLEGFYDDWALREREHQRRLYLNSLAHLLRYYKHHRNFTQSLHYGQQILDQEPLREEIHGEMIQLYLANGQRALAVRQYERCCELLQQELGIPPLAETEALYQQILGGTAPTMEQPLTDRAMCQQALQQLQLAMQSVDEARQLLQRSIQLVERVTKSHSV